jgi:hypothetical protein
MMGRMMTKGLAGDGGRRMQEGGGERNNQLKKGCTIKMPATEAMQQATTSRWEERTREQRNTNGSATKATNATMATTPAQPRQQGMHHQNKCEDTSATTLPVQ